MSGDDASIDAPIKENILIIAPNPASTATTIYYAYAEASDKKIIEVRDMQGRLLWQTDLTETMGNFILDTSKYANGHYFVVMKDNGKVIKHSRLVIK